MNKFIYGSFIVAIVFLDCVSVAFADYNRVALIAPQPMVMEMPRAYPIVLSEPQSELLCDSCKEARAIVLTMLKESCGRDVDDVEDNEMYHFLVGLNQRGVDKDVYREIVLAAENTVDCDDYHSWVVRTKTQAADYLM